LLSPKNDQPAAKLAAHCLQLSALIVAEETHYRRLLRLAWRQNSYMKRQDVDRLDANAAEWSQHLPGADQSRIARERLISEIAAASGLKSPPAQISELFLQVDPGTNLQLTVAMNRLRDTVGKLARQNELNRNLAEFCLDLAQDRKSVV